MADVMIPVLKDTKDPHYRYKMPKLTAKIEGSGNGIKTVLTNISSIAKAIYRPASYPTKYFGCELGALVTMNNDIYVINGSHDTDKLQNLLYSFIQKFVLCSKCKNPETSLTVSSQTIKQKCIACGHASTIAKSIHKLTTYIINHPPEATSLSVNNNQNGKQSKSKSSKSKKSSANNGSTSPNGTKHEQQQQTNELNNDEFEDDGFDDEEFTQDALNERLRDGLKNGLLSDPKESANLFYEMVKEKKQADLLSDASVQKELVKEAERLEIRDKSTLILSEVLFTQNILDEIKKYRILLLRFCNENRKAQKYLLGGFEKLVGDVYKDSLFNNSMRILKQFYDEDILDEESIIEWFNKESKKYVSKEMNRKIHEKVAPLIKWFKEAEVEEESEQEEEEKSKEANDYNKSGMLQKNGSQDDEDEDVDYDDDDDDDEMFEFSHRVSGIQIQEIKSTSTSQNDQVASKDSQASDKQDEEDIDIDNI